jgi:tRNA pseudouridine55 synthase
MRVQAKYLPGTGRGTATPSVGVEGHVEVVLPPKASAITPVPLHHATHGTPPRSGEVL